MRDGMFRGLLASAMLLLGTPAFAQSLASPTPTPSDLSRVLPVWSTESGRVEALLLVEEASPEISLFSNSALSELFSPRAGNRYGVRATTELSASTKLSADLGFGNQPALGLLCDGNVGIAAALGRLADQCLLARLDGDTGGLPDGWQRSFNLSGHWQPEDAAIDLSFGLSWLNAELPNDPVALDPLGAALGGFTVPAPLQAPGMQLQQHEFALRGDHWIGPHGWLRIEGRRGQVRLGGVDAQALFGLPNEWNSSSLSLSGGYRSFSGNITGKLIELEQPRTQWTDVDISVSWRTPWDARFSVGAKNLFGGPDSEEWPAAVLPGLSEAEARTPYVRYHQDL